MPKLYLVRHAEPEITGVFLGSLDVPLKRDAVMPKLNGPVERVYSSPLQRALATARSLGAPVVIPELAEICFGDWEGKSWTDIEQADPELALRKMANWLDVTPPGGEEWHGFTERVDRALEIVTRDRGPSAVVAHITVLSHIAHRLMGMDPVKFVLPYAGVLEVEDL